VRGDADGSRFEAEPRAASGAGSTGVGVRAWLFHQAKTDEPALRDEPEGYFMPVSFA
jgi:hypothetical protein